MDDEEELEDEYDYGDYCYECQGYGDDYFMNDDGELECHCSQCPMNSNNWGWLLDWS